MTRTLGRLLVITSLVALGAVGVPTAAFADIQGPVNADNVEEGDNSSDTGQGGESASGDAVAGQVTGVVTGGQTTVDATNSSRDVDVESGDTEATNESASLTGQTDGNDSVIGSDINDVVADNIQEGDNDLEVMQTASSSSGDAVGGQVIGVVTAAGGSSDVVAANASEDVDVETGDTAVANELGTLVGQANLFTLVIAADITDASGSNVQEGDNDQTTSQDATAASGDGVGGQVIGVVSAGDTSIDATNASEDVDLTTGDADAQNEAATLVGHSCVSESAVSVADISNVNACGVQEGDNGADLAQTAAASTGDGVGGQVAGAVTSAGGSTDIVAANTSEDVGVDTGDSTAANDLAARVGHNCSGQAIDVVASDIENSSACSTQEGDNDLSSAQAADASTGDGVGGQVLGAVSSGDTSIDATNSSQDVDLSTGDADATNDLAAWIGYQCTSGETAVTADIINVDNNCNVQEGDNDAELAQSADATTGDAVGGEVIGAVTGAGGSADIVAANSSEDVDVDTGDADAANDAATFVGQHCSQLDLVVTADITGGDDNCNVQEGDNDLSAAQSASAATGDGVGGQVLGAVSSGDTSIDATNASEDVDLTTGDAAAANDLAVIVGLIDVISGETIIDAADISVGDNNDNVQEGSNEEDVLQSAEAASGDAVGGQVAGVVTSAGGSADLVLSNTSLDLDAETGDSDFNNVKTGFVGLSISGAVLL